MSTILKPFKRGNKVSSRGVKEPPAQMEWTTRRERVYLLSSVIFQNHYSEKPPAQTFVNYGNKRGVPLPEVTDAAMQRAAYQLAFNALKYQELLEYILLDSGFYLRQPMPDHQMSLVAVMLYDLLDRKFAKRKTERDAFLKEVADVERRFAKFTSRLAASLARWRVKHELLSLHCMLPEDVRTKQERARSLMLYAWVNPLRSSLDKVQGELKRAGFSRVRSLGHLQGKTYCHDPDCGDVLVFPAQMKSNLDCTSLLSNDMLIVQDKACCVGPNATCQLLQAEKGDVLMAGCFSGLTVSHTASLISMKDKSSDNDISTVFMCLGDRSEAQRSKLQRVVNAMGCKNVKLIPGDFHSLDRKSKQFRKVRAILLAPKSSLSAINNPIEFILQEDLDTDLLPDLARGAVTKDKLESLVLQQKKDIDRAMQFPKILSVIYTSYSSNPEENEEVVRAVTEQARACGESAWAQSRPALDSEDQYVKVDPTEHSNGYFMAIFTRQAVQDVQDLAEHPPADVPKTTQKSPQKKSQASSRVKLKRREAKTDRSSVSIKRSSATSPKVTEPSKVLRDRMTSQESRKLQKKSDRPEKANSCSHADVQGPQLLRQTGPKVSESTAIVLPKANPKSFKMTPIRQNHEVHRHREALRPAVISLPHVDLPALFPNHTGSRNVRPLSTTAGEHSSTKHPAFLGNRMVKTNHWHA